MAFTVQYHPLRSGRIRPYIGAGASYMLVFGTKDGAFQDLRVDDDLGLAFEAGSDFMVTDSFGIFADVKKAMLRPCPPTLNRMIVRNPPYLPAPRLATRCLNTPPPESASYSPAATSTAAARRLSDASPALRAQRAKPFVMNKVTIVLAWRNISYHSP